MPASIIIAVSFVIFFASVFRTAFGFGEALIAVPLLALVLFAFSTYSLLRPRKIYFQDDRHAWIFGFLAGISGGSYGMNGPPLAVYGSLRGWEPARFRATLQGYFLPSSILGMCGYLASGLWTHRVSFL